MNIAWCIKLDATLMSIQVVQLNPRRLAGAENPVGYSPQLGIV
jgi:hypothetical protein